MNINKIVCKDCISLARDYPDNFFAMTLTDIPYDVVNRDSNGLRELDKDDADILTFDLEVFLNEIVRVTSGSIYVFCSTEQVSFIRGYLDSAGLSTRLGVWIKSNPSPMNGQYIWLSGVETCVYGKKRGATFNEHCKNTDWRYPVVRGKRHPTEKNQDLFEYLIKVSSNEGDVIFDPCAGSGTTGEAAIRTKRNYVIGDINSEYCKEANNRIVKAKLELE